MSSCSDLDLEDSKTTFPQDTPAHNHASAYKFGDKNVWQFRRSSGQSFIDILILCCDLGLEHSNPIFHRKLRLMVMYDKIQFGREQVRSSEDKVDIVTF